MAFPTVGLTDDFNRGDEGPPLSSNWTTVFWGQLGFPTRAFKVLSQQAVDADAGQTAYDYWNRSQSNEAFATLSTYVANAGVLVRVIPGENPGFYAHAAESGDSRIYRYDGLTGTQLGATITVGWASGDKIGIDAVGNTITAYRNTGAGWTTLGSRTDSTYPGLGFAGMFASTNSEILDDFGGAISEADAPDPSLYTIQSGFAW